MPKPPTDIDQIIRPLKSGRTFHLLSRALGLCLVATSAWVSASLYSSAAGYTEYPVGNNSASLYSSPAGYTEYPVGNNSASLYSSPAGYTEYPVGNDGDHAVFCRLQEDACSKLALNLFLREQLSHEDWEAEKNTCHERYMLCMNK